MPLRLFVALVLGLVPFLITRADPAGTPWDAALDFDYETAARGFALAHAARPADARTGIAHASTLLLRQPRTAANIEAARALLARIAADTTGGEEEMTVLATYLLARVEQDHVAPARPAAAGALYERLLREHPAHPLAGQAAVQLALLAAWPQSPPPVAERIARVEKLLEAAPTPAALRELHFILARLQWEERRDAGATLRHLLAGRALDYEKPARNAEVDLMIANLARQQGETALARDHYRAFLAANPRDARASTVRRFADEPAVSAPAPRP